MAIAGRYFNPAGRNVAGNISQILNDISRRQSGEVLRQREQQNMGVIDLEQSKKAVAEDAFQIAALIESGDVAGAQKLAIDRIRAGQAMGKDMSHTQNLLERMRQNPADAQKAAQIVVESAQRAGYLTQQRPVQFGSSSRYVDSKGNIYEAVQKRNTTTEETEVAFSPVTPGAPADPVGELTPLGASGRTSTQRVEEARNKASATASATVSIKEAKDRLKDVRNVRATISKYKEVQSLLNNPDMKIRTGPIMSKLPSIAEGSIRLNQLKNELGLEVITGATFGALSESELKFALATALPDSLDREDLKSFVAEKIRVQTILAKQFEDAARHFAKGGTIDEYLDNVGFEPGGGSSGGIDEAMIQQIMEARPHLTREQVIEALSK